MKIFDCFLFFNELELLELRLMTLSDVVDYFVLVEANKTFTGNKKEFLFRKNSHLYKKYLDKIIYIKVEDTPVLDKRDIWAIEIFQRNCIERGLMNAKNGDRIMISDVDEIPDPDKLMQVLDSNYPVTFNQHLFYYFVNCLNTKRTWNGPVIAPFERNMIPPQVLRGRKRGYNRIKNGGWHYTYMGGVEKIKLKLDNLSDGFTRRDQVGGDVDILRKINSQKNLWDENHSFRLINIDQKDYSPGCIKKFINKYPNFHFSQA